jgi:3-phenylpropionate/cinnamic acid dioxygenase small subunit
VISLDELLLQAEIERLFAREAELLDERRFDEWLELLDEDVRYRVPLARNVPSERPEREYSGDDEASWFDESKAILRKRIAQLQSGDHWAEEPRSRTTHVIANVRVDAIDGDEIAVKSRFVVCSRRLERDVDLFIGKRLDVLRRAGDGELKVVRRTVQLDESVLGSRNLTTFF